MLQLQSVGRYRDYKIESVLQRSDLPSRFRRVYLKREDLLSPAGGNKVRRFDALFGSPNVSDHVVALSDPGSHTFRVLREYLDVANMPGRPSTMVFLERTGVMTPYAKSMREYYAHDSRIRLLSGAFLNLWFRYQMFRMLGYASAGIGGAVRSHPDPFASALNECREQLDEEGVSGPVVHLFAIASGTMADGFLEAMATAPREGERLNATMTGSPITIPMLRFRYALEPRLHLSVPRRYGWGDYVRRDREFSTVTGVHLDPVHTIHLTELVDAVKKPQETTAVLWITCPRVTPPSPSW